MVYTRKLVTGPLIEPVSLAEAKIQCRVDYEDEDSLIESLITVARRKAESILNRQLITATWDVYMDQFPLWHADSQPAWDTIYLPLGELQSVDAFDYTDTAETTYSWTVSGSDLLDSSGLVRAHIDSVREPARIRLRYSMTWPYNVLKTVNPIHIRITCGYGDTADSVPSPIRHAIKMLITHLWEHRDAVVLGKSVAIDSKIVELAFNDLLADYRLPSFG